MDQEIRFKVLTLNCWGIPYISKNKNERIKAIAEQLSSNDYDVVCLQEVWSAKDYDMIKNKVKKKLIYSHYFYSGVLGSGICVFSKYPIQDVMFYQWSLNGYVHKIHHGDWFGGKGVGLCRLRVIDANVNVYVAHLHAEYDCENDEYSAHRILQAFDTAQFIRMTEQGADVTILGGDLNTGPDDLAYRIISGVASLTDSCSTHGNKGTSECANNSYTCRKVANKSPQGKRIDHILYLGSKNFKADVVNCHQPFPDRIPNKNFSFSDHEAVETEFKFTRGVYEVNNIDIRSTLKEASHVCSEALQNVRKQRFWYSMMSIVLVIPIIYSISLDITFQSIGAIIGLNIVRLFITALICYSLFMSSIWNNVEQNALKAGCLEMEIHFNYINSKYS
ncbi:GSCOCG00011621001-RA-CDS [Cotesia congregata]|nr:GSCOCG00011621001-RA-CDS [Cotesia congregata]